MLLTRVGGNLTVLLLRLLSSNAQKKAKKYENHLGHVGNYWKALAEFYQMGTNLTEIQAFPSFCHHFMLTKLATGSVRVKT